MAEPQKRQSWTFRVSRRFMQREDISGMAKLCGIALLAYADKDTGCACPTMIQLGRDIGKDEQTVKKFIDELRAARVITWSLWTDEHGHKRRNYSLLSEEGAPSERLFIPASKWDGLGGNHRDGRRTLM